MQGRSPSARRKLLHRTAGPYMGHFRPIRSIQASSASPLIAPVKADVPHFAFVPIVEERPHSFTEQESLGHVEILMTSSNFVGCSRQPAVRRPDRSSEESGIKTTMRSVQRDGMRSWSN